MTYNRPLLKSEREDFCQKLVGINNQIINLKSSTTLGIWESMNNKLKELDQLSLNEVFDELQKTIDHLNPNY